MKVVFILVSLLILHINNAHSQWITANGPFGEVSVSNIFEHDSLLFTTTNCGLFSQKNENDIWELKSTTPITIYTKIGNSLFVGSPGLGLRLLNLSNKLIIPEHVSYIQANSIANKDSILLIGHELFGFLKSKDFGKSWSAHNIGLPIDTVWTRTSGYVYFTKVTDIEVSKNYIYSGTKKGVYRSIDMEQWEKSNTGLPDSNVTLIKEFADTLFTVISNKLYRSADKGNNWFLLFISQSEITSIIKSKNEFYIGTKGSGVYYSNDNCISWTTLNSGLEQLNIQTLEIYKKRIFCGTSSNGTYYLDNNIWTNNKNGLICSSITSICSINNLLFTNDHSKTYTLSNNGIWTDITPKSEFSLIESVHSFGDTLISSMGLISPDFPYIKHYLLYSYDSGKNYNNPIYPPPSIGDNPFQIFCGVNIMYIYSDENLWSTNNLGVSWTNMEIPLVTGSMIYDFVLHNNIPFALANGIYKFELNSWKSIVGDLPNNKRVNGLYICNGAIFANIDIYGMYVSFNEGSNWTFANQGLLTDQLIRDFTYSGSNLILATNKGVYVTSDFGLNWYSKNDGLPNINTTSIEIMNDTIYVGTIGNGIWKHALSDLKLYNNDIEPKENIILFPIPSSNTIHFNSSLIKSKFKVYNSFGIEVLNGKIDCENEIDIKSLTNGGYILLLQYKDQYKTFKFLVNR